MIKFFSITRNNHIFKNSYGLSRPRNNQLNCFFSSSPIGLVIPFGFKMSEILEVKKVNQCGDYFLLSVNCPKCKDEILVTADTLDSKECQCGQSFHGYILDVKSKNFVLTVGTRRRLYFSIKKIKAMYRDQDGKCAYCQQEMNFNYHIEHVIPLSVGGTNKESNLVLSCPRCNSIAGSLVFSTFTMKQRYLINKRFNNR